MRYADAKTLEVEFEGHRMKLKPVVK